MITDLLLTGCCIVFVIFAISWGASLSSQLASEMKEYAKAQAKQAAYDVVDSSAHRFLKLLSPNGTEG